MSTALFRNARINAADRVNVGCSPLEQSSTGQVPLIDLDDLREFLADWRKATDPDRLEMRLDSLLKQPCGFDALGLDAGYQVRTEYCPRPDGTDRVDLMIVTDTHLIGIEIKIDAPEGPEQLSRYVRSIAANADRLRKQPLVILLAPFTLPRTDIFQTTGAMVSAASLASPPPTAF